MEQLIEKAYNAAFDLIELRLQKREHLAPFTVDFKQDESEGEIGMYDMSDKTADEEIEIIRQNMREKIKSKKIIAFCLCHEVVVNDPRTNKKTAAILIELAAMETDSVNIYVPYDFGSDNVIKKPFQTPSEQKYF